MVFTFDCPECQSKTEFAEDVLQADVSATSTFVCPSCQTLYDIGSNNTNTITRSKYDKTNYRTKTDGIDNQLAIAQSRFPYTVPCPHCKHIWEMKGIPIKSVHWCSKCYQYFGIDDVKISMLPRTGTGSWKTNNCKTGFRITPIYPNSIFGYDIDKLADWWSKSEIPSCDVVGNHLKPKS